MKFLVKLLSAALLFAAQLFMPMAALAADTSIANLNISGNVPVIFSITARGYPGDLDLSGKVDVVDRLVGIFHFKYNVDLASLTLKSAEVDGVPSSTTGAGTGYSFGAGGFQLKFGACTTILGTYKALFTPGVGAGKVDIGTGVDIKDGATTVGMTQGREEDCTLGATWKGTNTTLPLAGKYTLALTMTMVSI
ncbi:MAG: hypothetical protein ACAH59_07095 [Pseudobdellovibrionaceae bacterium]